jgi:uncharacterized Fe-S center protein/transcriptional regulator with XRE-family HTH domain
MGNDRERYKELADFLKTRRKRLSPEQVGLPSGQRRRTSGLRREELAQLAGIGVTWYTYLEQGRPIRVSSQVLESLARTLLLDAEERDYLFLLAHQQPPPVLNTQQDSISLPALTTLRVSSSGISNAQRDCISPTLLRMLDNLGLCPAYVLDQCFNVLAWNRAASVIFGDFSRTSGSESNLVWSVFTKPSNRHLYANWESQARSTLAQFRAVYGLNIGNEWFRKFVEDLMQESSEFKKWWLDHDVQGIVEGDVEFNHPKVGYLKLDHITFGVSGNPNLNLRVYTPIPGTDTADKIRQLLETSRYFTLVRDRVSANNDKDVIRNNGFSNNIISNMRVERSGLISRKAKSKLFFAAAGATNWAESRVAKAKELFYIAEFDKSIKSGDSVAIKIHFGEWNRNACLRPEDVACIVEEVKKCGGVPFVCDTTTLPLHPFTSRFDELHAMKTCYRHGFSPNSVGCPVILADGWIGHDDVRVEIPDGNILKETYIGRALACADVLIALSHAKGHPISSFGGAIKNLGIGTQSKRGKYCTHLGMWGDPTDAIGYPLINAQNCGGTGCKWHKLCEDSCPENAIKITKNGIDFNYDKCRLCYSCVVTCVMVGESTIGFRDEYFPYAQIAITDATKGFLSLFDPEKLNYITYIQDVTPECDCMPWAGIPIVPDLGILAGKDIVAIDTATLDLIDAAPNVPGSRAAALNLKPGDDKFQVINLASPRIYLRAAEKLSMGSMQYEIEKFEPVLSPENMGKHQIEPYPTTLIMRKNNTDGGHILNEKGVLPFKRTIFREGFLEDFV